MDSVYVNVKNGEQDSQSCETLNSDALVKSVMDNKGKTTPVQPASLVTLPSELLAEILERLNIRDLLILEQTCHLLRREVQAIFHFRRRLVDFNLVPFYKSPTHNVVPALRRILFKRCGEQLLEFDFGPDINIRLLQSSGFLCCLAEFCPNIDTTNNWSPAQIIKYSAKVGRNRCRIRKIDYLENLTNLVNVSTEMKAKYPLGLIKSLPYLEEFTVRGHSNLVDLKFDNWPYNSDEILEVCRQLAERQTMTINYKRVVIDLDVDGLAQLNLLTCIRNSCTQLNVSHIYCIAHDIVEHELMSTIEKLCAFLDSVTKIDTLRISTSPKTLPYMIHRLKERLTTITVPISHTLCAEQFSCIDESLTKLTTLEVTVESTFVRHLCAHWPNNLRSIHMGVENLSVENLTQNDANYTQYQSDLVQMISSRGSQLEELYLTMYTLDTSRIFDAVLLACPKLRLLHFKYKSVCFEEKRDQGSSMQPSLNSKIEQLKEDLDRFRSFVGQRVRVTVASTFSNSRHLRRVTVGGGDALRLGTEAIA